LGIELARLAVELRLRPLARHDDQRHDAAQLGAHGLGQVGRRPRVGLARAHVAVAAPQDGVVRLVAAGHREDLDELVVRQVRPRGHVARDELDEACLDERAQRAAQAG
jgi:hypothetical protein